MFVGQLATTNDDVKLIKPDVMRDAPLSEHWLAGPMGRETLRLMGVADKDNHESTLEAEEARINTFLSDDSELDWMIEFEGRVVGAIWVHLSDTKVVAAPTIGLMLGDAMARGRGAGGAALGAVLAWLRDKRHETTVYARHLLENNVSRELMRTFGFVNDGEPYIDEDNLRWQNVRLDFTAAGK